MPIDELNAIRQYLNTANNIKEDKDYFIDSILDYLMYCYFLGVNYASEFFSERINTDEDELKNSIYKKIDGKDWVSRIDGYIETDEREKIFVVVDTEGHRVYNSAIQNSARGRNVKKKWKTKDDLLVRDTHFYLEGIEVGIDDPFFTYDGDSALYPGDFSLAQNNVNCRCVIELTK